MQIQELFLKHLKAEDKKIRLQKHTNNPINHLKYTNMIDHMNKYQEKNENLSDHTIKNRTI